MTPLWLGRDDYYGHGRSDCADLARSPYLTSNLPPPELTVAGFRATARPRAGKTVTAALRVQLDGAPATAGTARCTARLAGRLVRAATAFSASEARCSWRLPAGSRGKRFVASVQARVAGLTASRSFTRVVR